MDLKQIFDSYNYPILVTNENLEVIFVNSKFSSLYNYEIIIDKIRDYYNDNRENESFTIDIKELRKVFKIVVSKIDDNIVFTLEDRTNLEDFLDKYFTLNSIINQAPFGVIITDIKGNIVFVNYGFEKLSGYTFDEVYGKNPRIWRTDHQNEAFYKNLWDTILSGKEWKGEFVNRKKNGELYVDESIIFPLFDEEGEIVEFCAIKQDITELKRLERNLIQNEKLVAMGRFVHNIAHDMKNILTGIYSLTDYLRARVDDSNPDKKIIEQIHKYVEVLKNFTYSLKNLGKTDSYGITEVNLCSFIKEITSFYNRLVGKNIKFTIKFNKCCDLYINQNHLEQILLNLIVNAKDAITEKFGTKSGGEIVIGTDIVDENVIIFVADNGKGIPPEIVEKVFSLSFTTKEEGTGVGLTIVKNIVENYEGKIEVESKEGVGTTFKIILPVSSCKREIVCE
ncbi:PAS domain S-box protein [Deferribacter autotrophicus]|uniref:histidine kinase n=1 Tax=Deferribacter autotrophicus TaxID=500465 RepID=A0A5A8F0X2_9BACT|nr:ATP-binding protein [Deferribacter autotrophicus]KAA0257718.1 PAS domain S-box protein [Deferribacter autotrophicus]